MLVAIDQFRGKAILGTEVDTESNKKESPEQPNSNRYRCLLCDSPLRYSTDRDDIFGCFLHEDSQECVSAGNVSKNHRLAQEVVTQAIFNSFPEVYPIQLDIEARIGGHSDFVVADVRMSEPYQIAAEIVYLSKYVSLRRRLRTLFSNNYRAVLVFVTTGRVSPNQAERHLRKLSPIQIGRFDPTTLDLTLGSVIDSNQLDPDNSRWDLLPEYLS
ncbi:MAG: hypothetical protein ABEI86_13175 [Halobacteriaceae archaeon]